MNPPVAAKKVNATHKPRLVAVASGKGGVGKTWLSQTLAQALGQRNTRVLVLDADLGLANANIQLGYSAEHDLAAVIPGEIMFANAIKPLESGGFDLLTGPSGLGALAGSDRLSVDALLAELHATTGYDVIILDLPAGLDGTVRRLTAFSDTMLLIITEDPASLTDAYAVLKLLKMDRCESGTKIDARIIVNQASSADAGKRAYAAFSRAARQFLRLDPPLIGVISRDERVPDAILQQKLLLAQFPQAKAGLEVQAIARRLSVKPYQPKNNVKLCT